jgi:hypothetical protein
MYVTIHLKKTRAKRTKKTLPPQDAIRLWHRGPLARSLYAYKENTKLLNSAASIIAVVGWNAALERK